MYGCLRSSSQGLWTASATWDSLGRIDVPHSLVQGLSYNPRTLKENCVNRMGKTTRILTLNIN